MKGLFHKVKNGPTRRRYVVSTVRKAENLFETAIFETNLLYLPRRWNRPDFLLETHTPDAAWEAHHRLATRLAREYPGRLFGDYG